MSTLPASTLGFERTSFVPPTTVKENTVIFLGTSVNGPLMVPQFIPNEEFALKVFSLEVREVIEKVGSSFKLTYSNIIDITVQQDNKFGSNIDFNLNKEEGIVTLLDNTITTIYVVYRTKQGTLLDHYYEAKLAGADSIFLMRITGSSSTLTLKDFKFESVFAGEPYNNLELHLEKPGQIISSGPFSNLPEKQLSVVVPSGFDLGFDTKTYNLSEFPTFRELVDRINDDAILMDCPAIVSTDNLMPVNNQNILIPPYNYFKTADEIFSTYEDDFAGPSFNSFWDDLSSPDPGIVKSADGALNFVGTTTIVNGSNFLIHSGVDINENIILKIHYNIVDGFGQFGLFTVGNGGVQTGCIVFLGIAGGSVKSYQDNTQIESHNVSMPAEGDLTLIYNSSISKITVFIDDIELWITPFFTNFVSPRVHISGVGPTIGSAVEVYYDNFSFEVPTAFNLTFNLTGIYDFSGGFDGLNFSPSSYFVALDNAYKLLSQIKKFGIIVPTGVFLNNTLPRDIPVMNTESFPDVSYTIPLPNGTDAKEWIYDGVSVTNGVLTMSNPGFIESVISLPLDLDERKAILQSLKNIIVRGQKDSGVIVNAELTLYFFDRISLTENSGPVVIWSEPTDTTDGYHILNFSTILDSLFGSGLSDSSSQIPYLKGFNLKIYPTGTGSVSLNQVIWRATNVFSRKLIQDETFLPTSMIDSLDDFVNNTGDPYFLYTKLFKLEGNSISPNEFIPRVLDTDPLLKMKVTTGQVGFDIFVKENRLSVLSNFNVDFTSSGTNGFLGLSFYFLSYTNPGPPTLIRTYVFDKKGVPTLPAGSVLIPKKTKFDIFSDLLAFISDANMIADLSSSLVFIRFYIQGTDYTVNINSFLPEKQYINDLLFAKRFLYFLGEENAMGNPVLGVMNAYDGTQGVNLISETDSNGNFLKFPNRIIDKINVLDEQIEMKDYLISPVVFGETIDGIKTNLTGFIAGALSAIPITSTLTNLAVPSTGHVFTKSELEYMDNLGLMVLDENSTSRFIVKGNTLSDKNLFNSLRSMRILQVILSVLSDRLDNFIGGGITQQDSVLINNVITGVLESSIEEKLIRDYDYTIDWDFLRGQATIDLKIVPIGEILHLQSSVRFSVGS